MLTKAFGNDGQEMRERLELLRQTALAEEGGASRNGVNAFLDSL